MFIQFRPEESKDDASDNRTESKAESHKPVQPHATPTQENIWNMLEKPTLDSSQPATESSLETIPGNAEIAEEDNSVHEVCLIVSLFKHLQCFIAFVFTYG